ncbi:MAG: HAD family hydrolase [Opitutaceae bacterium]
MTIVFDLDDTLYLEREFVRSGFRAVDVWLVEREDVDGFAKAAWKVFEEGTRGRIFDVTWQRLTGNAPRKELIEAMVCVYREHVPDIALCADASRTLQRLAGGSRKLGLVTDGPAHVQRAKIRALGIEGMFDQIVCTGDFGPGFGKPDARGFLEIATATGSRPGDCIYVADNPAKDFAGPNRLGWATVRVRRAHGLHVAAEHPAGSADHAAGRTVASLDELEW